MSRLICLALVLIFQTGVTLASSATELCTEFRGMEKGVQYNRIDQSPSCYVSLHPVYVTDLVYRDYLFSQNGLIMVFNSYGEGPVAETTGARVFYTFPRNQLPNVKVVGSEVWVETATKGLDFQFDSATQNLSGVSLGKVSEDLKVQKNNRGGVEILELGFLWMDSGFAMGHDPTDNSSAISTFHDAKGNSCPVRNSEVFSYNGGSVEFKLSDSEVVALLKKRCPTLQVSTLP